MASFVMSSPQTGQGFTVSAGKTVSSVLTGIFPRYSGSVMYQTAALLDIRDRTSRPSPRTRDEWRGEG